MKKLLLVNIIACVAILGLFEIVLRIFANHNATFTERKSLNLVYQPSGFTSFLPIPGQTVYATNDDGLEKSKIKFHINGQGYRGSDFPVKKPSGELRLVILGGSHVFDPFSFDYQGNPGFPKLIEERFQKIGINLRVINAGHPGHDIHHCLAKIIYDLPRFQPDFVILNSIWNDLKWISCADTSRAIILYPPLAMEKNPLIEPVSFLDYLFGWSTFYRKGRDYYWKDLLPKFERDRIFEGNPNYLIPVKQDFAYGLDEYRRYLDTAITSIQLAGAVPILAIEERLVSSKNDSTQKALIDYNQILVKSHDALVSLFTACDSIIYLTAEKEKVFVIDANRIVGGNPIFFNDHIHLTPDGSRFLADYYFERLKPGITGKIKPYFYAQGN